MQEGALRSPVEKLKTILNLMWRSKKKKKKKAQYACKKRREQYVSYEILETRDELHPTRNLTFPASALNKWSYSRLSEV